MGLFSVDFGRLHEPLIPSAPLKIKHMHANSHSETTFQPKTFTNKLDQKLEADAHTRGGPNGFVNIQSVKGHGGVFSPMQPVHGRTLVLDLRRPPTVWY